jgi:predicted CoA-binding protein
VKKSPWKLDPLFTPRSIAVIGASPNGGAGSIVLRNMQRLGYTGTVYPINPKYKEIFGYPCYASLRDLPAPADCAAVLLGSRSLLPMLEEAHAAGVKGVWGFASGFAETGGEGRAMQRRIHDFCHESGLLFCGPNCRAKFYRQEAAESRSRACACENCGKEFITTRSNVKYCSDDCRYEGHLKGQRVRNAARRGKDTLPAVPEKEAKTA